MDSKQKAKKVGVAFIAILIIRDTKNCRVNLRNDLVNLRIAIGLESHRQMATMWRNSRY